MWMCNNPSSTNSCHDGNKTDNPLHKNISGFLSETGLKSCDQSAPTDWCRFSWLDFQLLRQSVIRHAAVMQWISVIN